MFTYSVKLFTEKINNLPTNIYSDMNNFNSLFIPLNAFVHFKGNFENKLLIKKTKSLTY